MPGLLRKMYFGRPLVSFVLPGRARAWLTLLWILPALSRAATLDFGQAVAMALQQNPDLMAVQAQEAQARAGLVQARGARLPRLTASFNGTRTDDALNAFGLKLSQRRATFNDFGAAQFTGPGALGVAPDNLNYPGAVNNFNTRLEAQLPLYTGGKLRGYVRQAEALVRAAQAGDQAARQQVIYEVLRAYDGVFTARAYESVTAQALRAAQGQLQTVQNLYRQGVVVKSDLLTAQVNVENLKLKQDEAANLEAGAMDSLHVVLGLPLEEKIELGPPVEVAMPAGDPAAWTREAQAHNPQIAALRQQVAAAGGKVAVARADLYPQLGLMARYEWNDPHLGFAAHSYTLGGQLKWTVFDGGVTRGAIDQAIAARMETAAKLRQAEFELALRVQDAYRKAREAQRTAEVRKLAVAQSEEAARIVSKRYAGGLATLVEMESAQAQLDRARADLVAARQQVNLQRAALKLALGQLDPEHLP